MSAYFTPSTTGEATCGWVTSDGQAKSWATVDSNQLPGSGILHVSGVLLATH